MGLAGILRSPSTWLLLVWTALGAAAVAWGYRAIVTDCPSPETFSGCFEPPYRLSASVFALLWGSIELVLFAVWVGAIAARRRPGGDQAAGAEEDRSAV